MYVPVEDRPYPPAPAPVNHPPPAAPAPVDSPTASPPPAGASAPGGHYATAPPHPQQQVRSVSKRRVIRQEISTCFPLTTDRGMPCVHPTSALRFLFINGAWMLIMYILRSGGLKSYVDAAISPQESGEQLPLWPLRFALAAVWVGLPLLIVHCSQFGVSYAPCVNHPNYCVAIWTAPFLLWSGCSCCGMYNDAITVYHSAEIPNIRPAPLPPLLT